MCYDENTGLKGAMEAMKRIICGAVLAICGAIIDSAIIIAAAAYSTTLNSWKGSKLWYSVFGGPVFDGEANLSLNLGVPFVIGAGFFAVGIAILLIDAFKKTI